MVLLPVFVQVGLTFALLFAMATARTQAIRAGETKLKDIALRQPNWPEHPTQIANCFSNQFELPVLFYVLIALALPLRHLRHRLRRRLRGLSVHLHRDRCIGQRPPGGVAHLHRPWHRVRHRRQGHRGKHRSSPGPACRAHALATRCRPLAARGTAFGRW
jgi:hypothetical protein